VSASPVQRFARNPLGTDFVCGDLHGKFTLLAAQLAELEFDPSRDRLFATGDLVDRGPESEQAVELLAEPWFHSVRGNHDAFVLEGDDPEVRQMWELNGGEWWRYQPQLVREAFRSAFAQLPYAIEVETEAGLVGIVHADVPPYLSWQEFVTGLTNGEGDLREVALWSRRRIYRNDPTPVVGIERVYCGHTIVLERRPVQLGNVFFIDTGAYLGSDGALTIIPLIP